ncbi:MAG: hypothetical protein ACYS0G_15620 [Planctomycetota bacterium]|jgi:hypothetical protein
MARTLLKCCCLSVALAFLGLAQAGCQSSQKPTAEAEVSPGAVGLCTGCGQIKGSDACCRKDAAQCPGCGLAKGSPGCCKIEKGSAEPVALCTGCGQIKGSEQCCKPGQKTCAKCGLVKGSPGCCKIDKADM